MEPRLEDQPVETTLYSLSGAPPEPDDRRDGSRHLTLFRVGSITIGDRRELCLIRNDPVQWGRPVRVFVAQFDEAGELRIKGDRKRRYAKAGS